MKNFAQLTNFDLNTASIEQKEIHYGGKGETIIYDYKIISQNLLKYPVIKLGYCTETKGKNYPIFLTINGIEKEFQIGKTGMYEYQPEEYMNINKSKEEEKTAIVKVTEIAVPADIIFTLDYCYEIA